jgi:hypothetical protein
MTARVPPTPEPATHRTRVVRQTRRGWLFGWTALGVGGLSLWALLERAFVKSPASAQLWIIPLGLAGAIAFWRSYARFAPHRSQIALVVCPERLEYRQPGESPAVIERGDVALIEVIGNATSGAYYLIVRDDRSNPIATWWPNWAGWNPKRVVNVLRRAGYPALLYEDIYDGRFQAQTLGEPPRIAH